MMIGFFCVFRRDPQHYLHALSLIEDCRLAMPGVPIVHLTDESSPAMPTADLVKRLPHGPLLERRLEHYAGCTDDDWLLLDTDVSVRADVSDVFPPTPFDIAFADRAWPGLQQGDEILLTMPFNTGVCFCRNPHFWTETLAVWRTYAPKQKDWMSEQRAVYEVVRTGRYLVKILPGQVYNYPPRDEKDACEGAKVVHYKGPRKAWLTNRYYQRLRAIA